MASDNHERRCPVPGLPANIWAVGCRNRTDAATARAGPLSGGPAQQVLPTSGSGMPHAHAISAQGSHWLRSPERKWLGVLPLCPNRALVLASVTRNMVSTNISRTPLVLPKARVVLASLLLTSRPCGVRCCFMPPICVGYHMRAMADFSR